MVTYKLWPARLGEPAFSVDGPLVFLNFADFLARQYESEIQGIPATEFTVDRTGNTGQMGRETGI